MTSAMGNLPRGEDLMQHDSVQGPPVPHRHEYLDVQRRPNDSSRTSGKTFRTRLGHQNVNPPRQPSPCKDDMIEDVEHHERHGTAPRDESSHRESIQLQTDNESLREQIDRLRTEYHKCQENQTRMLLELQEQEEKTSDYQRRWKEAARELDVQRKQGRGFIQVTEDELKAKAIQLRQSIRDFAIRQFEAFNIEYKNLEKTAKILWSEIQGYLDVPSWRFEASMRDVIGRSNICKAYVWAYLVKHVFSVFCWSGKNNSSAVTLLDKYLKDHLVKSIDEDDYDGLREIQMWRAHTAKLLVRVDRSSDRESYRNVFFNQVNGLTARLKPFSKSREKDLAQEVSQIIEDALELDILISQQAAEIYWLFGTNYAEMPFETNTMQLEQPAGSIDPRDMAVDLIMVPGLAKRGKSNGEDFDMTQVVLKMVVACSSIAAGPPHTSSPPDQVARSTSGGIIDRVREGFSRNKRGV